ncbi:MAG: HAD family hydrolase [Flavobacteriales bacterium]|nr:HAD family hydrolase [Flavobacteriales bacterium]
MTKALFLDRDGVLNRELGRYVASVDEFELLPTVVQALKFASDAGFLLIIISNQGGVAKGLYGMEAVHAMQRSLQEALDSWGVSITEGYYCPHHPDHGLCLCRKPKPLMLQKAIARFGIDPARSFMIGDGQRDMDAANAAGVNGILMPSNGDLFEVISALPWA